MTGSFVNRALITALNQRNAFRRKVRRLQKEIIRLKTEAPKAPGIARRTVARGTPHSVFSALDKADEMENYPLDQSDFHGGDE